MRFALLLVAAVLAIVAGFAVLQFSGNKAENTAQNTPSSPNQSSAVPGVSTVEVLVARTPIEVGAIIEDAMVDRQPWPSHLVIDGFITSGSANANVVGKVARAPFQAREPLMVGKLANPNDPSFLAASLAGGNRAVTVSIDAISGVAGYIFPGDRVDVVFTHNIPQMIKAARDPKLGTARVNEKPGVSEVLLPNVRVLAVNTRQPSGKEAASVAPTSVTLEVGLYGAQQLRLAEKNGTLSLSLRSVKDQNDDQKPNITSLKFITQAFPARQGSAEGIRIVRGVETETDEIIRGSAGQLGVSDGVDAGESMSNP